MSKVLIIGCGGVASVAIRKCCQVQRRVYRASASPAAPSPSATRWRPSLAGKTKTRITTAQVDADDVDAADAPSSSSYQPDLVMNIALPYQDLTIMDACLECGVNYMDTANYEPEDIDDPDVARHL